MKQSEINKIKKKIEYVYVTFEEECRKKEEKLQKELNELTSKCDHKFPNGESAIRGSMFCNSCEICNWCDM